jgi:hypothetical protein
MSVDWIHLAKVTEHDNEPSQRISLLAEEVLAVTKDTAVWSESSRNCRHDVPVL